MRLLSLSVFNDNFRIENSKFKRVPLQAADVEAVAREAALVAFDRANHMGISAKTAEAIKVRCI